MSMDSMYAMEEELGAAFLIIYAVYYLISIAFGITTYVLSSLGLYTIAKRRCIANPWLAWIPVANLWIVGSISDQFRYVTKGQIKNKRKILVGLFGGIIAAMIVVCVCGVVSSLTMGDTAVSGVGMVLMMVLMVVGMLGAAIAYTIIYYMAMYDLYTSVNPAYNVVFLVLSIIFRVTEPFFIFCNRKKELGMPVRCAAHAAPVIPTPIPEPIPEPWENNPEA